MSWQIRYWSISWIRSWWVEPCSCRFKNKFSDIVDKKDLKKSKYNKNKKSLDEKIEKVEQKFSDVSGLVQLILL